MSIDWRVATYAQTMYVLPVTGAGTQQRGTAARVHRTVVIARMTYAASGWHGFTKASDRQRINSQISRAKRSGYCPPDLPTFEELCTLDDEQLFSKTVRLSNHVSHALLPPPSVVSQYYSLSHCTLTPAQ